MNDIIYTDCEDFIEKNQLHEIKWIRDVYDDGSCAFGFWKRAGGKVINPYPKNTLKGLAWQSGWDKFDKAL